MCKSGVVRSLTFKDTPYGDNISKEQAIENSANWTQQAVPEPNGPTAL